MARAMTKTRRIGQRHASRIARCRQLIGLPLSRKGFDHLHERDAVLIGPPPRCGKGDGADMLEGFAVLPHIPHTRAHPCSSPSAEAAFFPFLRYPIVALKRALSGALAPKRRGVHSSSLDSRGKFSVG